MSNQADFKVKNGLVVNTTASFLSTITSISTTTGGVQISGGVGIAKDVYIGGVLNIVNATSATSTTTGALKVTGGAGFQGDIYARNIFSNGQQVGLQSNTTTNLAGGQQWAVPYQSGTGTTTFMSAPPVTGTTYLQFSTSTGFTWTASVTGATGGVVYTPYVDTFTGTGSTTTWALSTTPAGKNYVSVIIDGVDQLQNAWDLSGSNIVFTESPASGATIEVKTVSTVPYTLSILGSQGNLQYLNNGNLSGTTYLSYSSTTNVVSFTSTTNATSTTTGAVVISGGVGIAQDLYVGGKIVAQELDIQYTTVTTTLIQTDDIIQTTNTTPTNNTTTGALKIGGGVGIAGGLFVGAQITATTRLTVGGGTSNDLVLTASQIYRNGGSVSITGGSATVPNATSAAGFVANNNATVDIYGGSGAVNLRPNANHQVVVYSNSSTFSTQTGGLQIVNGGVGIGGGVFVGGNMTVTNAVKISSNTESAPTSAALLVSGGATLGGGLTIGGSFISAPSANARFGSIVTATVFSGSLEGGAAGSLPYQTAANVTGYLAIGTSGYVLTSNGTAPAWSALSGLSAGLATTATNLAGGTAGQFAYQTAPGLTSFVSTSGMYVNRATLADSATTATSAGTAYATIGTHSTGTGILGSSFNGSTNQTWSLDTSTLMLASVNLTGGVAGQLHYQSSANTSGFISTATTGNFLQANYAGAPTWTTTANIYVQNAVLATHQRGGTAGQLQYQSAVDTTAFVNTATTGNFLQANYTGAPTWTTTGSMYVYRATLADSASGSAGSVANALTIGTGLTGSPSSTYNGSAAVTISLNTATLVQTATQVVQSHSTGTGILGSAYNGSTAQTWTLDTSTLMARAVQTVQSITAGTGLSGTAFNGSTAQTWTLNTATLMQIATQVVQAVTFNNSNTGDASGTTYNGSTARTVSANTLGALSLASGGTISGAVTFSGPVTFSGTATYVSSTQTYYTDNIINLHVPPGGVDAGWTLDDGKDIGLRFHYYTNSTDTNAALVLANDSKFLEWYSAGAEGTSTFVGSYYGNFKTGNIVAGRGLRVGSLASSTATVVGEKLYVSGGIYATDYITATTFVGAMSQSITAGTGLTGTAYNGGTAQTWTLNTATLMQIATQVVQSHSTGTGILGSAYNGSTAQTWTLDTSTLMNKVVNLASGAAGSLPYQSGANATTYLGIGTSGYILTSNGSAPTWTAATGLSAGSATTSTSAGTAYATIGTLTAGAGLTGTAFNGSANQTWTLNTATLMATATQVVQSHSAGTGLTGSAYNGSTAQTWSLNTATLMASAVSAINLSAGTAMSVPYQSASGTTAYLAAGTSGYVLQTNGTGSAPSWVAASSLTSGSAGSVTNALTINNAGSGAASGSTYNGSSAVTISYNSVGAPGAGWLTDSGLTRQGNSFYSADTRSTNYAPGDRAAGLYADFKANSTDSLSDGGTYHGVLTFRSYGTSNTDFTGGIAQQIAYTDNSNLWHRGSASSSTWGTWYKVIDTGNTSTTLVQSATQVVQSHSAGTGLTGSAYNGSTAQTWTLNTATLMASAVSAINLSAGSAMAIPYQSASGTTAYLAAGTSGYVLTTNGTGSAPTWTAQSSIAAGSAPLTNTYVGYGSASNLLTGSSGLTYASSILNVSYQNTINTTTPGTGTYGIHLNGQSTNDYATGITFSAGGSAAGSAQSGIYSQGSGSYGTKMYFATTDSYASGAKTRMMIDYNGNVGIGTTSPSGLLHLYNGSNPYIRVQAGGGNYSYIQLDDASSNGYLIKNLSASTANGALAGALYTYTDNSKAFQHIHSGTPLFTILSGGNVGIGTTGPGHRLDIIPGSTYSYAQGSYSSGATLALRAAGTSANDYTGIRFTNSNGSREAFFGVVQGPTAAVGDFVFQTYSAFTTSYAERMRVQHNGNVVIGANGNTSTNKFEVQGLSGQLFSVTDSFTGTIFSANDVSGIPSIEVLDTGLVKFAQYNGSVAISTGTAITSNGMSVWTSTYILSLGVGTSGSGTIGEIRASNEVTAYYSSDARLKENVRVISDPIEIVKQIRGVYFDWTDDQITRRGGEDGYFVRKHDVGVIAQEVQVVLPELVGTREDGYLAVKYEKMVPLLIEAIKEQQKSIDMLKFELEKLKNSTTP